MNTRPAKTVLTCAVTGGATDPKSTPYLPITPEQIATSALEAAEAGAAVVHLHVRDPDTGMPSTDINLYADVVDRIRKQNSQVLINLTTGPGARFALGNPILHSGDPVRSFLLPAKLRVRHIEKLRPDICSIDFNTMHQGDDFVRINHRSIVKEMLEQVQAVGCKPELEIFDSGDLRIAQEMIAQGTIKGTPLWQFAMGIKYGWPSTYEALDYARRHIEPGSLWSAFAISREQMPFVAMTWCMGGHVRVGMEDNIYLERGVLATSNSELVKKAVGMVKDLGGSIANYQEAREIYCLN
jgi:uncharacterized protein (DUF849 family)